MRERFTNEEERRMHLLWRFCSQQTCEKLCLFQFFGVIQNIFETQIQRLYEMLKNLVFDPQSIFFHDNCSCKFDFYHFCHYGVPLSQGVKLVLIVLAMCKGPVHNKYVVQGSKCSVYFASESSQVTQNSPLGQSKSEGNLGLGTSTESRDRS